MKRLISLVLAALLASYCGTAPQAELQSDTSSTTGTEQEQGSDTTHYVVAGGVAVVAACLLVPGSKRLCQKHFRSAKGFRDKFFATPIKKTEDAIKELKDAEGDNTAAIAKLEEKLKSLQEGQEKLGDDVSDGIMFTAYDKTLGSLSRGIKKRIDDFKTKRAEKKAESTKEQPEGSSTKEQPEEGGSQQ